MQTSRVWAVPIVCAVLAFSGVALAEDVAPAPPAAAEPAPPSPPAPPPATGGKIDLVHASSEPPRGKIDLSVPSAEPRVPRTYHMHDGFYARASVGIGSLHATLDDDQPESLKGSGASFGLDLMLGGSPTPGVAVGGALLLEGTAAVDLERGDVSAGDRALSLAVLGPFIDGFPSPSRGWHFGGTVGLAQLAFGSSGRYSRETTGGIGGAFWLGNDIWVADDWSVGPLLKFAGALTRDKKDNSPDLSASAFSISILFTALYH